MIRVVSYNVHGWITPGGADNVAAVGDVLEQLDPDIVALNEVFSPGRRDGTPLDDLARRLDCSAAFGACLVIDGAECAVHQEGGPSISIVMSGP